MTNYIVLKHGFALKGWIRQFQFQTPDGTSSIEELETLESAIENRVYHWIEQTGKELKKVKTKVPCQRR